MEPKAIFSTKSLLMAGSAVFFCDLHSGPPPKPYSDVSNLLERRSAANEADDRLKQGKLP